MAQNSINMFITLFLPKHGEAMCYCGLIFISSLLSFQNDATDYILIRW